MENKESKRSDNAHESKVDPDGDHPMPQSKRAPSTILQILQQIAELDNKSFTQQEQAVCQGLYNRPDRDKLLLHDVSEDERGILTGLLQKVAVQRKERDIAGQLQQAQAGQPKVPESKKAAPKAAAPKAAAPKAAAPKAAAPKQGARQDNVLQQQPAHAPAPQQPPPFADPAAPPPQFVFEPISDKESKLAAKAQDCCLKLKTYLEKLPLNDASAFGRVPVLTSDVPKKPTKAGLLDFRRSTALRTADAMDIREKLLTNLEAFMDVAALLSKRNQIDSMMSVKVEVNESIKEKKEQDREAERRRKDQKEADDAAQAALLREQEKKMAAAANPPAANKRKPSQALKDKRDKKRQKRENDKALAALLDAERAGGDDAGGES